MKPSDTDYLPISCMQHERLEFSALRRIPLEFKLVSGVVLGGVVLDVYTSAGAEWLKLRDAAGAEQVIRLDQIASFSEV